MAGVGFPWIRHRNFDIWASPEARGPIFRRVANGRDARMGRGIERVWRRREQGGQLRVSVGVWLFLSRMHIQVASSFDPQRYRWGLNKDYGLSGGPATCGEYPVDSCGPRPSPFGLPESASGLYVDGSPIQRPPLPLRKGYT